MEEADFPRPRVPPGGSPVATGTAGLFAVAVYEERSRIAPEIDLAGVASSADLRAALGIDSINFLKFVTAIRHRLGADSPEPDFPRLITPGDAVADLTRKVSEDIRRQDDVLPQS